MARINYTEEQIETVLTYAQEVGLGRAIRDLGYPAAYGTAMRWAEVRGVSIDVDPVKQRSQRFANWYKDEEKLIVAQAGLERVYEQLIEGNLTSDDLKKLSEATKKYVEVMALVAGKPTHITQDAGGDDVFKAMLAEFNKHEVNESMSPRVLDTEEER